jgi:hypothetical protein
MQINQLALSMHMHKVPPDRLPFGQTKSITDTAHFSPKSSANSRTSSTKSTDRTKYYFLYPSLLPPALEFFLRFQTEHFAALGTYIIDYIRVLVPYGTYLKVIYHLQAFNKDNLPAFIPESRMRIATSQLSHLLFSSQLIPGLLAIIALLTCS